MTTPNLQLPEVPEAIQDASDEINQGFRTLDAVVQLSVLDKDLTLPPVGAVQGDRFIVPAGATGPWLGWERSIAFKLPSGWLRVIPREGWRARVLDEDAWYIYISTQWTLDNGNPGITSATVLTLEDESEALPNSVRLVAGDNVTLDLVTDTSGSTLTIDAASGSGGIESIVAGDNVTVDSTDPANPIVNASGVVESLVAGGNITIDDTDPANPIISAAGGGGGGAIGAPLVQGPSSIGSDNLGWGDFTLVIYVPGRRLINVSTAAKLRIVMGGAANLPIAAIVMRRTLRDSTTYIDSTNVNFGGVNNPTLAPGLRISDTISATFDIDHDYYFLLYHASGISASAGYKQGNNVPAVSPILTGFASGNQTAAATFTGFSTDTINFRGCPELVIA